MAATRRSSSPFVKPITPCGVMSSEVNPNWASWGAGCRVIEATAGGAVAQHADGSAGPGSLLADDDAVWCPPPGASFPHEVLLHFPSHPAVRYMGWDAAANSALNPKTATFYSGPHPDSLSKVLKCQALPGSGVQIWHSPAGIPATHSYVKVAFSQPFSWADTAAGAAAAAAEPHGIARLYLFEEEPNIKQAQSSMSPERLGVRLTASATLPLTQRAAGDAGARGPSPLGVGFGADARRRSGDGEEGEGGDDAEEEDDDEDELTEAAEQQQYPRHHHHHLHQQPVVGAGAGVGVGGRSPSPPAEQRDASLRRRRRASHNTSRTASPLPSHASASSSSRMQLHSAMEGLDYEVRKLHKLRGSSPAPPLPPGGVGVGGGGSTRSVSPDGDTSIVHPAATARTTLRDPALHEAEPVPQAAACVGLARVSFVEADPAWMTVFRSYDDRLARCENQVQKVLAMLELQEKRYQDGLVVPQRSPAPTEPAAAAELPAALGAGAGGGGGGGGGGEFPSEEMQAMVLNWVRPTMQRWAKQIEKKITRNLNQKIDESFEKITQATIDKKVQEILKSNQGSEGGTRRAWQTPGKEDDPLLLNRKRFELPQSVSAPSLHDLLKARDAGTGSATAAAAGDWLPAANTSSHVAHTQASFATTSAAVPPSEGAAGAKQHGSVLSALNPNSSQLSGAGAPGGGSPAHIKKMLRHALSLDGTGSNVGRRELRT